MTPFVIVGMGVLFLAFVYLIDVMAYPWAHSLVSHPTLTGAWYGPLLATHGGESKEFGMYLQIEHDPWKSWRRSDFDGRVEICTPDGILTGGSIYGSYSRLIPTSTPLDIYIGIAGRLSKNGKPVGPLERPYMAVTGGQLKGKWNGDTLTISGGGSVELIVLDGAVSERSSLATKTLTRPGTMLGTSLKRGNENDFFETCTAISAREK